MKFKTQLLILITAFCTYNIFGQINTEIIDITVDNQTIVSNCNSIDLEDNNTVSLDIYFKLTKPSAQAVSTVNVKALLKYSSNSTGDEQGTYTLPSTGWSNNNTEFYGTIPLNLSANDIQVNGSSIFIKSITSSGVESNSCEYPLEKDEVPSFSLAPTSITVSCGSTSVESFDVTPTNIPSGATVSYQWNVGSGWLRNGNPVSSFTTTSTNIQLTPYQYPPDDVRVTPILNGVSYPQLTCTVSSGSFNPTINIVGDDYVCNSGIYTLDNIASFNNLTVQSVSSSNNNIATASYNAANGEITVNKVSDGIISLSVIIQNSCNQIKVTTKELQIGIPASVFNATITGSDDVCQGQNYTYTLVGANHPCINGVVWSGSSNLNIVPQTSNTITVSKNNFDNDYAGQITASIPGSTTSVSKGVWVGVPGSNALSIQKIDAFDLYAGRWSKLRARYTPLMYVSNGPLDVAFEWQIPNSQIRNYANTAYKDVNPNRIGQLTIGVRATCDCGNGQWKYRTFDVDGGGGLIPVGGN